MTTITKAGASLVDHMNDDATELNSFFSWTLPGSLHLPFFKERAWD